jgi:hypothetical protein
MEGPRGQAVEIQSHSDSLLVDEKSAEGKRTADCGATRDHDLIGEYCGTRTQARRQSVRDQNDRAGCGSTAAAGRAGRALRPLDEATGSPSLTTEFCT